MAALFFKKKRFASQKKPKTAKAVFGAVRAFGEEQAGGRPIIRRRWR